MRIAVQLQEWPQGDSPLFRDLVRLSGAAAAGHNGGLGSVSAVRRAAGGTGGCGTLPLQPPAPLSPSAVAFFAHCLHLVGTEACPLILPCRGAPEYAVDDIAAASAAAASAAADDGAGPKRSGARSGVTLAQLVQAGAVLPGQNVITVAYKGASYSASLNAAGAIEYEGQTFVRCAACGAAGRGCITGCCAGKRVVMGWGGGPLSGQRRASCTSGHHQHGCWEALFAGSQGLSLMRTLDLTPISRCAPPACPARTASSPTAFSIHVKRKQTPGKAGDDGWVSVHYLGRPLAEHRQGPCLPSPCLQPRSRRGD